MATEAVAGRPAIEPGLRTRIRQLAGISAAFVRMGYLTVVSYPASFFMGQVASLTPVLVYYFVNRLAQVDGDAVGGDYYTFIVVGYLGVRLLAGGLAGLGASLEEAIKEGRLEDLLIQPTKWDTLPFGLVQWTMVERLIFTVVALGVSLLLGAQYALEGVPVAIVVMVLGCGATMAVGIAAGAVKLIVKRTEPILTLYTMASLSLAGVYYPVTLLPGPLRWASYCLPDTYVIAALRRLVMPDGDGMWGPSAGAAILGLLAFNAVAFPVALWLFRKSLDFGRRQGTLAGY